jgi:hypothetical protein
MASRSGAWLGRFPTVGPTIAAFFAALAYATVRYNLLKGVPWSDWPTYIVNKAFAFGSLILIVIEIVGKPTGMPRANWMAGAGLLVLGHLLLSTALMGQTYYPAFFTSGKYTLVSGVAITLGVAAALIMYSGSKFALEIRSSRRCGTMICVLALLIGAHAAFPDLSSWADPTSWPGGLPPMSMLTSIAAVSAIGTRLYIAGQQRI